MALSVHQRAERIRQAISTRLDVAIMMWETCPSKYRDEVARRIGEPLMFKLQRARGERDAHRRAKRVAQPGTDDGDPMLDAERMRTLLAAARADGRDVAKIAAASPWRQHVLHPWLSAEERERCRAMRATAVWGKKVRCHLECSQTELDRWDHDGRLPHAFTRPCFPGGKAVRGRKWFIEDVERAEAQVALWRRQDAERRRARRTKLRLVVSLRDVEVRRRTA